MTSSTNLIVRVFNKPLSQRVYQGLNGIIVKSLGNKLVIPHVVEYPKCGGSWVRNMLQTYLGGESYFNDRIISPKTVVHLHRLGASKYSFPIILFRDPRDVFVSYYFHEKSNYDGSNHLAVNKHIKFSSDADVHDEFEEYLKVKLTQRTDPYFTYQEFYESWKSCENKCEVFYENFKRTPQEELAKVLEFVGENIDLDRLDHAVEYNSFENVTLRKFGKARKPGSEDVSKFQRKGISGDWVNYFNNNSCHLINEYMGDMLIELGYETSAEWIDKIK